MPPKRFKRKSTRGGAGRGGRPFSTTQRVIKASGKELMATIAVNFTTGTAPVPGMLGYFRGSNQMVGTFTGVNGSFWPLNPWQIGPRCRDILNAGYTMYKVRKLNLRYRPAIKSVQVFGAPNVSEVNESWMPKVHLANSELGGPLTTYEAAFGFNRDPTLGPLNFEEVIESGGKVVDATQPFSFSIRFKSPWLFTTYAADAGVALGVAEARQEFFGQIMMVWRQPPFIATTTQTDPSSTPIGDLEADWVIDFKFPIDTSTDDFVSRKEKALAAMQGALSVQRVQKTDDKQPIKLNNIFTALEHKEDEEKSESILVDQDESDLDTAIKAVMRCENLPDQFKNLVVKELRSTK